MINIYVTGFLYRKKHETLIMGVYSRGLLLGLCSSFGGMSISGFLETRCVCVCAGVIVHVWPARQVNV